MTAQMRKFHFSVTLLIPTGRGGALVWWPAEALVPSDTDDDGAIDYLNQVLVEDGTLRCTKLETDMGDQRIRTIRKRVPTIIGKGAIATITPLHVDLIEQGDE